MLLAHLSDLHVRPSGMPAYRVVESTMLAERALRAVATLRPRPDAVGEYDVLVAMLRQHLDGLPVYLVPGNHDRRDNFRAALGGYPGVLSHPDFVQFVIDDLPVRLVMLDSVVPGAGYGELCAARLDWLDRTLATAPTRPTILVLHHPPILCGIGLSDAINLHSTAALQAVLARHEQVERILCGHHHRPIVGRLGRAIVCAAPSVAHQGEMALRDDRGRFVLEPPAFMLHLLLPDGQIASHTVLVESFAGPFPYIEDPDYPGKGGPKSAPA
jgi:3',5'-cyclic AMP phosphodiesterase CpdA